MNRWGVLTNRVLLGLAVTAPIWLGLIAALVIINSAINQVATRHNPSVSADLLRARVLYQQVALGLCILVAGFITSAIIMVRMAIESKQR